MDKKEYIVSQMARTKKKKYEQYVVTRMVHLLDDLNLKFVTQQYVYRPDGHALTDLFFPQLNIHIEVDEAHHKDQVEADKIREQDIVNATDHEIVRIDATKSLQSIKREIDNAIVKIKEAVECRKKNSEFSEWDYDADFNPKTYVEKGEMNVKDDVKFRTVKDACNCFGYNYKGCQRGYVKHPVEENTYLWFPLLNPIQGEAPLTGDWDNRISQDENMIQTKPLGEEGRVQFAQEIREKDLSKRIVFVKVKDSLGATFYRFRGVYRLSSEQSLNSNVETWVRIATRAKTYPQQS